MTVSSLIRWTGFWCLDLLKGGHIASHLRDLERSIANPSIIPTLSQHRLTHLLDHAVRTTKFYKQFRGTSCLSELPVIEKATLRTHYHDFFSSSYDPPTLTSVTTSGSYGTPFTFYLAKEKSARRAAEMIFFSRWAGYQLGMKHAFIVTNQKSRLTLWLQNQLLMDPTILDHNALNRLRHSLLRAPVTIAIGHPSVFEALAHYSRARGDKADLYSIESIITIAQPLSNASRETIQSAFGCTVLARYSLEECGVVAHECPQARNYHLNSGSYVIEVLSTRKDEPVARGELGRIVVTDLFSHAMPLIRYDTGDLGVLGDKCSCGFDTPILEAIEGRAIEAVYDTGGVKISPFAINRLTMDMENVIQFQFIQKAAKDYTMRLCIMPAFGEEQIIRNRLIKVLGEDANIKIEYVDSIPPLKSGKRPYIINEYGDS